MKGTKTFIMVLLGLIMSLSPIQAKKHNESYNFTRALEEAKNGNKKGAMEYFNKEVVENPKNGYAYMAIAAFHMDNSEYGDARTAAESALKYLPKKDKKSLAKVYLIRSGLMTIECDTVAAYSDIANAIRLDPSNEEAYEKRGQLYYEQDRYDEGDADYQKILQLNPGGVMGRMGLGRNAYARKDYDQAIAQYNRIIAINPDYSSGYSFRAEAYLAKGEYLKAVDDICKALEIDSDSKAYELMFTFPEEQVELIAVKLKGLSAKYPHSGEYFYYTGLLYAYHKMYNKSNEVLKAGYDIDARTCFIQQLAENSQTTGNFSEALEYVTQAQQMMSDNIDLIQMKADILGESGNIEGAISEWSKYIEKNPDFFGGYYRRGWFKDVSMKTDEAIEDYKMAIMLQPDYAYAHFGLADMLMRKGEKDKAQQEYAKVLELDSVPNNGSCAMYALLSLDRKEEAISFMNKVLENDTTDAGNYYDAACFYSRIGDYEASLVHLRKALDKGFRRFYHIRHDDDLEKIRQNPDFEDIMSQYETQENSTQKSGEKDNEDAFEIPSTPIEIPFTPDGGCALVKCSINELPLSFIFDTGASIVSLSQLEANFMLKNGYLSSKDIVGNGRFIDANGEVSEGTVINLREVDFGGLKLKNVRASVVRNQKAPLLLGQSVLGRLGKIEIDNNGKKLIITQFK